jgi:hypothetical protein
MKYELPALLLTLLLLAAMGCSGQPDTPAAFTRTQAGLTATLTLTPDSPVVMQPVQLLLTLRDTRGHPVDGARVAWNLTMPDMAMPENTPKAVVLGEGRYRTKAIFTMAGKWRIEATVTRPEGATTLNYDITIS